MSLFNVCNWWSTQCSDLGENYDVASLMCARFGLETSEKDYIIVGSQTGYLSIFYPTPELEVRSDGGAFKPTDLLLEMQLKAPILGVYAGRFSGNLRNENTNQLGVLHPNSIAIYNIQVVAGMAEHGTQLRLQLQVEYKFRRVAFSLCKGHFGQIKGREFFCVVHLDGILTFFEQDGISYECKFPGYRALPSPVVYCERTDSFFRLNATWNLECFSYQDLSHSSLNKTSYKPTWSVCIGEGVIDMNVLQVKEGSSWILIMGERNFISLQDNGKLNFILKLEYVPKCFFTFMIGYYWEPTSRLITAIVSDESKLFIYEESNIIWAAQYQNEAPVAIQRSNVNGLPGSIVTLGPSGQLTIGYLGSDPFLFKVQPLNTEQLSFAQAHKELHQLEDEINEAVDVRNVDSHNQQAADNIRISFTIRETATDNLDDTLLLDVPADVAIKELPAASGTLKIRTKIDLSDMQVVFSMPPGVRCSVETLFIVDMSAGTTKELELDFFIAELLHMHTARVDVVISYINTRGIPRVVEQCAYLPLNMFYKPHQPQKSAGIKLTYTITSKSMQSKLSTYFPEFVTFENDTQALGLLLICPGREKMDEVITIVAAKSSNRIRLQSDNLEAFPLILERLVNMTVNSDSSQNFLKLDKKKLKGILNRRAQSIVAAPFIPVQEILHRVDVHHETQENIRKQTDELDELWLQFKTLQRKLQEKPDDEPKESLVMQIEENYDHLILEGDKLVQLRKDEKKQRSDLNCAISTANSIISSFNIEDRVVSVISSVLCTPVNDWTELSWEESMSPGIDMLHHYGPLSRSNSSQANSLNDSNVSNETFDFTRFRRHFSILFDRIVRLTSTTSNQNNMHSTETQENHVKILPKRKDEISELNKMLELDTSTRKVRHSSLEAVEDDEEEFDEDDLREVGYRKDYGIKSNKQSECSEWINEDFELPTTEELFSDLGIWW